VSNNLNPETVMAALKEVKVPGTRVDVVSIDLIGEIKVSGGEVTVSVVKTTEKDETIAAVREDVMQAVSALPGVLSVQVPIDDRSQPKKAPTGPHGQSPDPFADRKKLTGVEKVVAVASAKGGVGKSSVAVNLALALLARGHKVGLLDADVYGPSVPTMLGIQEGPEITEDKKIMPPGSAGDQHGSVAAPGSAGDLARSAGVFRGPPVFEGRAVE